MDLDDEDLVDLDDSCLGAGRVRANYHLSPLRNTRNTLYYEYLSSLFVVLLLTSVVDISFVSA